MSYVIKWKYGIARDDKNANRKQIQLVSKNDNN